jgi:hypothetical protein
LCWLVFILCVYGIAGLVFDMGCLSIWWFD